MLFRSAFRLRAALSIVLMVGAVSAVLAESTRAALPDNRAYELVSPSAKNGADVVPQSSKTRVSLDGNRVAFNAVGGFRDVRGTSVDIEYLGRRTGTPGTSGWTATAVSPRNGSSTLEAIATGNFPTFEAAFSTDLSQAIYRSWLPLSAAPNVADVLNLYRLDGLGAGEPVPQLLTNAVMPLTGLTPQDRLSFDAQALYSGSSDDLTHVLFETPWNITSDGSFGGRKLYEYVEGVGPRLVGRIPSGTDTACDDTLGPPCVSADSSKAGMSPATKFYSMRMISRDGARIAFQVPGDGALEGAIYLRENGTKTVQLNASEKRTPEQPGPAALWDMTPDGRRSFFTTSEGLVGRDGSGDSDDDGKADVYMYDLAAPRGERLTRLSIDKSGSTCFALGVLGASDDGHYVYFLCAGQLVPGEPPADNAGLYLWHDGEVRYVGEFPDSSFALRNTSRTQWSFLRNTRMARISPDGRYLLFTSRDDAGFRGRGGFPGYDHGSTCTYDGGSGACRELYLYSADHAKLVCVSCNPLASIATGDAILDVRVGGGAAANTQHLSQALTADGRRVFFSTPESLVAEDANGTWDAYEYDVPTGTLHLISTGKGATDSYFVEASANGDDVLFATRERLVGWDIDDAYDLYDARVGGGFAEPVAAPADCSGEACRAALAGSPATSTSSSAQYRGAGDRASRLKKARRACRGRTVARRVRGKRKCVKRTARRHQRRHARRATVRSERSSK